MIKMKVKSSDPLLVLVVTIGLMATIVAGCKKKNRMLVEMCTPINVEYSRK